MQITELVADGLKRSYACTLAAAELAEPYEARLAEIAKTMSGPGLRPGTMPMTVVKQRFGAAVLGEVLEDVVAHAKRRLVEQYDLRPAVPPSAEIVHFAEGSDLEFRVHLEVLPEIPIPRFSDIVLEQLRAEPTDEAVEQALAARAMRHGALVQVDPRPAALGDILVCDLVGRVPGNLLINGAGIGSATGTPGVVPREWSVHLPEGLHEAITATGVERGLPWFDLAVTGTTRAGGTALMFPGGPQSVTARAGSVMTVMFSARVAKGALPDGATARFGFNLRSKNDFIGPLRAPAALMGADRASMTLPDDPAVAYARPVFELVLPAGATADFTLRVGPARAHAGNEEPPGAVMPGASARDMEIEVGGRGFIRGFADQLEGLAPGDSRDVEIVFPPDYAAAHLAGAHVRFAVTAKALKVRRPHALDDALARLFGAASLDDLRLAVRNALRNDYAALSRRRLKAELLERLSDVARFPVPRGLLDAQRTRSPARGGPPQEPTRDEPAQALTASQRALAERRIRLGLLLTEIGQTCAVAVDPQDMDRAIQQEARRYAGQEEQVLEFFRLNPTAGEGLHRQLLQERVIDFVLDRVTLETRDVTAKELEAMAP